MAAYGTKFIEFKEEVLPKLIPAVIDEYWYPEDEEDGPSGESDDELVVEEGD